MLEAYEVRNPLKIRSTSLLYPGLQERLFDSALKFLERGEKERLKNWEG